MTKLPQVKPKKLGKALNKLGFKSRPGKGSHVVFYHKDGRYTSIPMHSKPIGKGLLYEAPASLRSGFLLLSLRDVRRFFVESKIPPKRKIHRVHPRADAQGFPRRRIKFLNRSMFLTKNLKRIFNFFYKTPMTRLGAKRQTYQEST